MTIEDLGQIERRMENQTFIGADERKKAIFDSKSARSIKSVTTLTVGDVEDIDVIHMREKGYAAGMIFIVFVVLFFGLLAVFLID